MKIPIVQLNKDTGIPPESKTLEQEGARLHSIQTAAERAQKLVADANSHSRFQCEVKLPAETLDALAVARKELADLIDYAACVKEIERYLSAGIWADAEERFKEAPDLEGGWKLHLALKTGREIQRDQPGDRKQKLRWLQAKDLSHPVLACFSLERGNLEREFYDKDQLHLLRMTQAARDLCGHSTGKLQDDNLVSWLTTPILSDHSLIEELARAVARIDEASPNPKGKEIRDRIKSLLNATPGDIALQAAIGDVRSVSESLRKSKALVPHNLAVAVFARMGEDRSAQDFLSEAISASALFACCYEYREKVAAQFRRALPQGIRPGDRDVRGRVCAVLEQMFKKIGVDWGQPTQADSWACRWEVECSAITKLVEKGERLGDNTFPFGPALVQFFQLQEKLAYVLRTHPEIRTWYGPCANSMVVLYARDPHGALESLQGMAGCCYSKAHGYPGYATLPNAQEALKKDANLVFREIWFALLNLHQFKAGTPNSDCPAIADEIARCCKALIELQDSGIELADRLARTLRDSFVAMTGQIQTEEDAQVRRECMTKIIDLLATYNNAARPWLQPCLGNLKLKRADLILKLADIRFGAWDGANRKVLQDLSALIDVGLSDAPTDPALNIRRAEVALLFALVDRDIDGKRVAEVLERLQAMMIGHRWPSWAVIEIQELMYHKDIGHLPQRIDKIRDRWRLTEK
ncbi:MAG TPA: hypothetical protein VG649_14745 [Candidatus Angelobacter sp.]|nr:hypothetical protein [Candidatus Angelobacter sp.]